MDLYYHSYMAMSRTFFAILPNFSHLPLSRGRVREGFFLLNKIEGFCMLIVQGRTFLNGPQNPFSIRVKDPGFHEVHPVPPEPSG